MKRLAAAVFVFCVSCAPLAHVHGGPAPGRSRLDPAGYYEDEPQSAKVVGGIALSTLVITGFVIAWPEIEDLFAENLSTWFYGY